MAQVNLSFNSNMVRLKVDTDTDDGGVLEFQFQYGTIKRSRKFINHANNTFVSIPIWYD